MDQLKITWKKSAIGYNRRQKDVIRSLGLRKLSQSVVHADSATIRGMINKVPHLVKVEKIDDTSSVSNIQ